MKLLNIKALRSEAEVLKKELQKKLKPIIVDKGKQDCSSCGK